MKISHKISKDSIQRVILKALEFKYGEGYMLEQYVVADLYRRIYFKLHIAGTPEIKLSLKITEALALKELFLVQGGPYFLNEALMLQQELGKKGIQTKI